MIILKNANGNINVHIMKIVKNYLDNVHGKNKKSKNMKKHV